MTALGALGAAPYSSNGEHRGPGSRGEGPRSSSRLLRRVLPVGTVGVGLSREAAIHDRALIAPAMSSLSYRGHSHCLACITVSHGEGGELDVRIGQLIGPVFFEAGIQTAC